MNENLFSHLKISDALGTLEIKQYLPERRAQIMKPGRELDALVAEKVMGWGLEIDRDGGAHDERVWHPSTDISAAWEVVEKLLLRTEPQDIHLEHLKETGWGVTCCHEERWSDWTYAPTAPHAICLAALKAVGYNPET